MYDQRMQLLLSKAQRTRLDRESARTGRPISELVREAIDVHFEVDEDADRRRAAADWILSRPKAENPMSIEEINELIDSRYDEKYKRLGLLDDDEAEQIERRRPGR